MLRFLDPESWDDVDKEEMLRWGWRYCAACERLRTIDKFQPRRRPSGTWTYYADCRECISDYNAGVRHKYLQEKRVSSRKSRARLRYEVLSEYCLGLPPQCECCAEDKLEFLALDHTNGGGNKHKKEVRHVYRWIKKNGFPPGFRVLCHNCNQSLGAYGYCPHSKAEGKALPEQRATVCC